MAWIRTIDSESAREEVHRHQQLAQAVWRSGSGLTEAERHMIFRFAQLARGLRLRDVVDPRGPAAEILLGRLDDVEPGDSTK